MWYTGWHASAHAELKARYSHHMFYAAVAALALTGLGAVLSPPYIATPYELQDDIFIPGWVVPEIIIPEEPKDFLPEEEPFYNGPIELCDDGPDVQPNIGDGDILKPLNLPRIVTREFIPPEASEPVIVHRVRAEYPELAIQVGMEGEVIVQVMIDKNGRVIHAEIFRSAANVLLESAALEAARQYLFKPGMQGNVPVKCQAHVRFVFRLDH